MAENDKQDFAFEDEQDLKERSPSDPQEEDEARCGDEDWQEDDEDLIEGEEQDEDLEDGPKDDEDEDQDDDEQEPDACHEDDTEQDGAGTQDKRCRPALTAEDLDNTKAVTRALNRAGHEPARLYERSEDLPYTIKRKLEALDQESAQEKEGAGIMPDPHDDGGSRFFGMAQAALSRSKGRMSQSTKLFKKNFKIFLVIIIAFAGYYVYLNYIGRPVIQSFSELKQATPLQLDDYTTLNKVEEDGPWIVMEIIKDEAYYQGQSIEQREESLDRIEANAQSLCSNSILGSMIRNGRKITVLLKGSAGSFTRNFTVEQCPGTENDQSH